MELPLLIQERQAQDSFVSGLQGHVSVEDLIKSADKFPTDRPITGKRNSIKVKPPVIAMDSKKNIAASTLVLLIREESRPNFSYFCFMSASSQGQ